VGQLGNCATNNLPHSLPARILLDNNSAGFSNIVMLAARDWHNIAVKADGSVWQWGANDQGQCGDNTTIDRWRPVQVAGLGPRVGRPLKVAASAQPGQASLAWPSAAGEFFSIEFTTNLAQGFSGTLQANLLATPPTNVVIVPMTNAQAFYRLKF
jgi:alpha-tubulin suppressor-like RCC1 family protein